MTLQLTSLYCNLIARRMKTRSKTSLSSILRVPQNCKMKSILIIRILAEKVIKMNKIRFQILIKTKVSLTLMIF